MKKLNKKNIYGYTVIVSLIIIGLLLVLSTGILNMILNEMKDNKGMGDNIKAYAGAESAQELALLQIKEKGYGYYEKVNNDINDKSIILSDNPLNRSVFNKNKDVLISYNIGSKVSEYNGKIAPLKYNILPLFYSNDLGEHKINNYTLDITEGEEYNLAWNIIGNNSGISGTGTNTLGIMKKLTLTNELKYTKISIPNFLSTSNANYLVLFNISDIDYINYNIKSYGGEYFSKPQTNIISSGEIGDYKQNLDTNLDNTKFLNRQKYSIYSK